MNQDKKRDQEMHDLMMKSVLDIPHIDFEDKLMEKIKMVEVRKETLRKSLKASWIFLLISILLFPAGIIAVYNQLDFSFVPSFGESINSFFDSLMPGVILIFSVVILLQIDNLLRLTFRARLT